MPYLQKKSNTFFIVAPSCGYKSPLFTSKRNERPELSDQACDPCKGEIKARDLKKMGRGWGETRLLI